MGLDGHRGEEHLLIDALQGEPFHRMRAVVLTGGGGGEGGGGLAPPAIHTIYQQSPPPSSEHCIAYCK